MLQGCSASFIEVGIVAFLILFNGVLAMAEMAMVTARTGLLQQRADAGSRGARAALRLKADPNRFLSTVQVGITLVGILAGAFGGATIAGKLETVLDDLIADPYDNIVAVAVVVAAITYASLIIGELVPKRLALRHPEALAARIAGPMTAMAAVATPVVTVLSGSTSVALRLLGLRDDEGPRVTEEEIRLLIAEGREAGIVDPAEQEMMSGVFRLGDRRVDEIMTPRPRITWIDINEPVDEALTRALAEGHSHYLVARENLDELIGVATLRAIAAAAITRAPIDLAALAQPPLFIPESMHLLKALEAMKAAGWELAVVVDEFGGTQGIVTLSDVVEEIVGEVRPDGTDRIQRRDDGSWLVDGTMPFADFRERVLIGWEPGEPVRFSTVGGYVMTMLGRVPRAADWFTASGWRFEVVDMDGNRVDKILAAQLHEDGEPATSDGAATPRGQ